MTLNRRDAIRLLAATAAFPVIGTFMPLAPIGQPLHRIVRFEKASNRERGSWMPVSILWKCWGINALAV